MATSRPGRARPARWWRAGLGVTGLVAGLGVALLVTPGLRLAPGPAPLPLTVDASLARSGEVGTAGGGQLLTGVTVVAGGPGRAGALQVASETSVPVDLTVQDVGQPTGFEERVWVHITVGDTVLFDGPRAMLREGRSGAVRLLPGQRAMLTTVVSVPAGVPDGHQGRRLEMKLKLTSVPVPVDDEG